MIKKKAEEIITPISNTLKGSSIYFPPFFYSLGGLYIKSSPLRLSVAKIMTFNCNDA